MYESLTPNLIVRDVDKSADFYVTALGFTVVHKVPRGGASGFAILKADDVQIMLQSIDSLREDITPLAKWPAKSQAIFFIVVSDVVKLWNQLKDKVDVVQPMRHTAYGMDEFYVRDPNGYVLGFAQRAGE